VNITAIKTAIYQWARAALPGITIYWDSPGAPRPPSPSIKLTLLGPGKLGEDEIQNVEGSLTDFRITGPRTLTVSINSYGSESQQLMTNLQSSLSNPDMLSILSAALLSVTDEGTIKDLSALVDTHIERRMQMDVNLLTVESIIIQPGYIDEVHISSSIGGVDNSFIAIKD
jgi:hypothetical protein